MRRSELSRFGYPLGVAILLAGAFMIIMRRPDPLRDLVASIHRLDYRTIEGRIAQSYPHKPYRRIRPAALPESALSPKSLRGARDARTTDSPRLSASALLLAGRTDDAVSAFVDLLRRGGAETDVLRLIEKSNDSALLTDFGAAALERSRDDRDLLLAYEAADRAWQLSQSLDAGWNRALAAYRIGMYPAAERAWREIRDREPDAEWAREAEERRLESERRANAPPPVAMELFFQRDLFTRTLAGEAPDDVIAEDRLASDTNAAIANLRSPAEQKRLHAAIREYLRGRDAVDRSETAVASEAYAAAEVELGALRVPLALISRDQRIRCDCVLRKPGCLEAFRELGRELAANGRHPWLAARVAFGEGQTLYRQGRVYEAAKSVELALAEHRRLGDVTGAAQMHSILVNIYAAGGESDLALRHFLQGVVFRAPPDIVDRRRRVLEDGIVFMLRHGYLATAELLLDELKTAATTDAARVYASILDGVAAFRRGDPRHASQSFSDARTRLRALPDATTRADYAFRLAIAEAGSRMRPARSILADLDAGIAVQSGPEYSIWLPPLLTERGATFEDADEPDRAEADYLRAIDVLESREPRIDQTVLALGLTAPSESPFDRAIRLLLRRGRIVDALSIADRASALRISSLHARGAGVRDVFRPLRERGDGIADARAVLRGNEIAVTQYLLRDELVTWLITKDAVRVVRHPVRRDDVVRLVEKLPEVDALSAALLHPWIALVPRGATLLLQPAAELEAVPLAMLETREGERVVWRNASATSPNLRALANAANQDVARAGEVRSFFAAAADPGNGLERLPRAVAEVTSASQRYAGAAVEPQATRASFLAQSPAASIVHFAGHIVIDAARPLFSALVFDRGELLYVHELEDRSFAKTRLVVLSGCDSGRSPRPAMSVANALLSQRVPSVVYTFHAVDDDVAEAFALEFHRALSAGRPRAEAMRDAQQSLIRARPDDPTTWAAFALAGAAGPISELQREEER